jgi:hypothetical protein
MAQKIFQALALFFVLFVGQNVSAESRVWNGTSGYWTNETKWGGTVPQADDAVTFPVGAYTVTLDSATAELGSYTQNGGILFFTNWTACLRADDVLINSGRLDHALCNTNAAPGVTNRVYISGSTVTLGALARIDVAGRGFPGTIYKGMGPGGGEHYCWGGSYGGLGGRGHLLMGYLTPVCGASNAPAFPGSGGGGGSNVAYYGDAGGGVVRIEAIGTLTVNGTISAMGATSPAARGGGGSGGSIFLSAQTFAGAGALNAAGGASGAAYGGGGGGGRISITFDATAQSNTGPATAYSVRLEGGKGVHGSGEPGTLFLTDPQNLPNPLPRNAILHLGVNPLSLSLASLTMTNFSLGFGDANVTLQVAGDLAILATNGVFGFSMEPASMLSVGGNIVMTNTFLRMASSGALTSELACAGSMSIRDARVTANDITVGGDLTVFSPAGSNGVLLTNGPALSVGGNIFLKTNSFITLVSRTNLPARLQCEGSVTLESAALTAFSCPTGAVNPSYGALVEVKGDLILMSNAWVYPRLADPRNESNTAGQVLFRMRNLNIATNAGFNGDGSGYAGSISDVTYTNGFGPGGGYIYAGGAGYGGTGGVGHATLGVRYGAPTYGDSNAPVQPGSGGACASGGNGNGGNGGGSVVIEAAKTVSLDGTITASGVEGTIRGGGGSGGSIFITCATFNGPGLLRANGGKGGVGLTMGGGGGGGRIAVRRVTHGFSGSATVAPGTSGYAASTPSRGTVVWLDLPVPPNGAVILVR